MKSKKRLVTYFFVLYLSLAFILIPVLLFIIENIGISEKGLVEFFIQFNDSIKWWRYLISIFVLSIFLKITFLLIQKISKYLKLKKVIIITFTVFAFGILDFFLEHPAFLGIELIFPKTMDTKFIYASNEFNASISAKEKYDIFNLFINESTPYFILDSLNNNAGHRNYYKKYKIPLSIDVKNIFQENWIKEGNTSKFISDRSFGLNESDIVIDGYGGIYSFSPIKKVGGKILIGYDCYISPLGSHGGFYEIEKIDNKWVVKKMISMWIS